jgi:DNA-binding MarR family transcriptional regulator
MVPKRRSKSLSRCVTACKAAMSVAEVHALMDMHAAGPISQRDLAAGLCLEKSTVSRMVRLMEGRGWVKRTTATHDRRVMHVSLSEAGKTAAQHLAQARGAKFARVLAAVPQEMRVSIVEAVSALAVAARDAVAPDASKGQNFYREHIDDGRRRTPPKPDAVHPGAAARSGSGARR